MKVIDTEIPEVKIIEPVVYKDNRGYFYESFNNKEFTEKVFSVNFMQDNESCSSANTLRGMHWQKPPYAQSKLVRCTHGALIDFAIDIRVGSPTFMKYVKILLTPENKKQFFIPRGFAHGFISLEDNTVLQYKCDNLYNKESEGALTYKIIPELNKKDETFEYNISDKDMNAPSLEEAIKNGSLFKYNDNLY